MKKNIAAKKNQKEVKIKLKKKKKNKGKKEPLSGGY
jgi:hypothetical protein